jgi:DNA-binding MarR family transcriptional regulator
MDYVPSGSPTRSIDESLLSLENSLSFRISVAAKLLDRRLSRLVAERFGLAVAEYRVLAQVTLYPRSTVRSIAERTYVDKAQVSRAVAVLETMGLVMRATPASDRRSPVFTATKTGRQMVRKIVPKREAQERELATHLEGADLVALEDALQRLIVAFSEPTEPDPGPPPAPAQRRG